MTEFLPEWSCKPHSGGFKPMYRLFSNRPFRFVAGVQALPTADQAIEAAKECVKCILNPPIRAEQAEIVQDVLGVDAWHRERAGQAARDQQEAFGQIFVKGRAVAVEKRRARV